MKSFTPIDLERRSFTGLRCVYILLTLLVAGGSLYVLIALSHNLWLAAFLLLANGLMIYGALMPRTAPSATSTRRCRASARFSADAHGAYGDGVMLLAPSRR